MLVEAFMQGQHSIMADEPRGFDISDPPTPLPQLGLFHLASIAMRVRWFRKGEEEPVYVQRFFLGEEEPEARLRTEAAALAAS